MPPLRPRFSPQGIAGAAALIAVLTVGARVAGFARTIVFAGAVGPTDLGSAYQTANLVPNIIFEIVAGGALATMVVPLLAGAVAGGDGRRVGEISSALLTWVVAVLTPLAVVVALAAEPIISLLGHDLPADAVALGARMLRIFAIQLPLYGIGIVLAGTLQAHRRYVWPVLAPLLSSLVVIGAYLLFAALDPPPAPVRTVSTAGELVLSVGTTLGVAVLTLCLLVPLRGLRLRLRPRFAVEPQLRRRAVRLAGAAVITVAAQQLVLAYFAYLVNGGPKGALVIFGLAQTAFLLPWAVFAVPVATSAFPELAEAAAAGGRDNLCATLARTTRAVLLLAGLGVAGLVAVAGPFADALVSIMKSPWPAPPLAAGIVAFAPGLFGYGLLALLSRALYAAGEARRATLVTAAGWALTAVAGLVLATSVDRADRVAALAAANSVGMTAIGLGLLVVVARRIGRTADGRQGGGSALGGVGHAAAAAIFAAVVGGAAGSLVAGVASDHLSGLAGAILAGMVAGVTAVVGFIVVGLAMDRRDLRPMLTGLIGRLRSRRQRRDVRHRRDGETAGD
jgi:putative peptidoglycan lipid II flippase